MDPCPYVRILVGNLAVKFPLGRKPSLSCFCKIKLKDFPTQVATIPLQNQNMENASLSLSDSLAACFTFDKSQIGDAILGSKKQRSLSLEIFAGSDGDTCGGAWRGGKLLGKINVVFDLKKAESRPCVLHNGWTEIGNSKTQFHLSVRAEPDPRYVFQFGGEPECSPQVFQVQGSTKQAVFTCKFSFRNPSGDRNLARRQSMSEPSTSRNWLHSIGGDHHKEKTGKERKGWTITIHDLSGSPVAMASMVTPFVPSPNSDGVSQSNPGAWLILRPSSLGAWEPWGRLEAWRQRSNALGYRFQLFHDVVVTATPAVTTLLDSVIDTKNGAKFTIDMTNSVVTTPVSSPHSSCDFGSGSWSGSDVSPGWLSQQFLYKGFVMSSTMGGNGKCTGPDVEIGAQHVNCTEDAAAFVALAAAVDLSKEACRLFSHQLRKQLRQPLL